MSKRASHLFQFAGKRISTAAERESEYHAERLKFWTAEHRQAIDKARAAGLEVHEYPVTGGVRAEMVVDPTLQGRINECANKIHLHRKMADQLQIESACYGTQPERMYELEPDDVVYFRLAGGPRED
jgi:hypothetical protein